jgi:hypothetical protein
MTTIYKILGQIAPANTSNANLYTVPAETQTVVSTLNVANVTGTAATFSIYVRNNGAAASDANALGKGVTLAANSIFSATQGITLAEGDIITVQSSSANALTFHAFGSEVI